MSRQTRTRRRANPHAEVSSSHGRGDRPVAIAAGEAAILQLFTPDDPPMASLRFDSATDQSARVARGTGAEAQHARAV